MTILVIRLFLVYYIEVTKIIIIKFGDEKMQKRYTKIFLFTFTVTVMVGLLGLCIFFFVSRVDRKNQGMSDLKAEESILEILNLVEEDKEPSEVQEESLPEQVMEDGVYYFQTTDPNKGEVLLGFAGDINFADDYSNMAVLKQRGGNMSSCIDQAVLDRMRSVDIMMLNNEFTYTKRGTPVEGKTYTFRSNPDNVSLLSEMGVDLVSLANNHAYDYGEVSLLDTMDTLQSENILFAGAGKTIDEAAKPIYIEASGVRIAYICATQIERVDNPDTKGATKDQPGVFRCWNIDHLLEVIKETKKEADITIVYVHWGTENETNPDWAQLEQAKKISEAGADAIIGNHTHCLQGIEKINSTLLIYSLGNFWFNSKTQESCMVEMIVSKEGIKQFRFIPAMQKDYRTTFLEGAEKDRVLEYMRTLSKGVTIDQDGYVDWD